MRSIQQHTRGLCISVIALATASAAFAQARHSGGAACSPRPALGHGGAHLGTGAARLGFGQPVGGGRFNTCAPRVAGNTCSPRVIGNTCSPGFTGRHGVGGLRHSSSHFGGGVRFSYNRCNPSGSSFHLRGAISPGAAGCRAPVHPCAPTFTPACVPHYPTYCAPTVVYPHYYGSLYGSSLAVYGGSYSYYDSSPYGVAADEIAAEAAAVMQGQGLAAAPDAVKGEESIGLDRMRDLGIALGRGDKAFQTGDYADARQEYLKAAEIAPGDARTRVALGLAEFALGHFKEASAAIRLGVAAAPRLAGASLDLVRTYGKEADFQEHKRALETHLALHPDDLDAQFLAGFVRYFNGDRSGGIALFRAYREAQGADPSVAEFISQAEKP